MIKKYHPKSEIKISKPLIYMSLLALYALNACQGTNISQNEIQINLTETPLVTATYEPTFSPVPTPSIRPFSTIRPYFKHGDPGTYTAIQVFFSSCYAKPLQEYYGPYGLDTFLKDFAKANSSRITLQEDIAPQLQNIILYKGLDYYLPPIPGLEHCEP